MNTTTIQELNYLDNLLTYEEEKEKLSTLGTESNETKKNKINELNDISKIKKDLNEIETIYQKRFKKIIEEIKNKKNIMDLYNLEMKKKIKIMSERAYKHVLPSNNVLEEKENGFEIKSKIINKKEDYNLINDQLKEIYNSNNDIKYELLYRASEDGPFGKIFKKKCSKIKKTLIVVETKKNKKFGGFTEAVWDDSGKNYKDEKTFCFSFNENTIYTIKKYADSISCQSDFGPIFCNMFAISDKFASDGGYANSLDLEALYYNKVKKDFELTGEEFFQIQELEAFKIQLN
jgi:hypothetical protein